MKVTTHIDFTEEGDVPEGYVDERSVSRTVEDLDPYDWLWYLMSVSEAVGFDVKDIKLVTNKGTIYEADW